MTSGAGNDSAGPSGIESSTMATDTTRHESGGIGKFFENLVGSDDTDDAERAGHASTNSEAFNRGSFALTVHTANDGETDKAEAILNAAGAIDVDERAEAWRKDGWAGGTALSAGAVATASSRDVGGTRKLQEVQEELKVGKRAVARGGVRVFTRLTEVPVEESVTLREEHADIKRTSVDRVATAADLAAFKEGSIEIRETGEEAVVSKTARVTGEVEVGKTATEHQETVRDTLRQTKVEVEKIASGDAIAAGSTPADVTRKS